MRSNPFTTLVSSADERPFVNHFPLISEVNDLGRITLLVIAHRLSTVKNAHRIVVVTDSGIGEQGTHDELIALEGAYASLYKCK